MSTTTAPSERPETAPCCGAEPPRAPLAERLLDLGGAALSDPELVALLIGSPGSAGSARTRASRLLDGAGGLRRLALRTPAEIATATGLGVRRAARLAAALEIGRRAAEQRLSPGHAIEVSADVFRHFHVRLRDLRVEQFHVLLLDGKHRVVREELVSQGTLTSSPVHPREVFAAAIRHSAAAAILVHNHPSGDPAPSADDLEITRRLASVGELVGIKILDHVIVGDGAFTSLADRGLIV
jgi:DNA repair protein RadC